jgi:Branched-chain amino acid ABC-type transport system, permease components
LFSGHPVMALGAAVNLSLTVGALVYVFLMRKMTGEMVLAAILTTVALGILIRGLVVLIWSAQQQYPAQALGLANPSLTLPGDGRISMWSAVLVLTNVAVYGLLFAFLRFGRWGMRMRAAGQNPLLAAQRGINLHSVYALAWSLSTLTGALAGILMALDSGLTSIMPVIGLKAFPAALVGGLDSLAGALVGALIVAAAEVLLIYYVDPLLSDVVPFLVLVAMLIVRPWGLFGTREELDRV